MEQNGVAAVVAVVILAVLGVGVAVSVGAFIFDLQLGLRDIIAPQQVELEAIDTTCSGSQVDLRLVNTGQKALTGENASAFLYEADQLLATEEVNVTGKNFTRIGGIDDLSITFSASMDVGTFYRTELDFPSGYTFRATCYAE